MRRPTLLAAGLLSLIGCSFIQREMRGVMPVNRECDAMGKREPSWAEEREVGATLAIGLASRFGGFVIDVMPDGGVPPDTAVNQLTRAVAEVGQTVAAYSPRAAVPWSFLVVDNPDANAWSTPGGYVLVTKGLLARMTSESQLAGVLAHEVAHTTLRHALHTYREAKVAACYTAGEVNRTTSNIDPKIGNKRVIESDKSIGQLGAALILDKVIEPTIDKIVTAARAHDDEYAADAMALELLVMAGYDPREYTNFLATLPNEKKAFSSHPPPTERTKRLEQRLATDWKDFGWEQHPKVPLDPRIVSAVTPTAAR